MLSETATTWLREHDYDPAQLDRPGKHQDSALILASRRGERDVVAELIAAGASLNQLNMDGTNALWAAVVADSYEIADALLTAGVDIDNQNENGATALMYAASNGKSAWVEYLLSKGANHTLRSLDDYSALDLASTREILGLLRKLG